MSFQVLTIHFDITVRADSVGEEDKRRHFFSTAMRAATSGEQKPPPVRSATGPPTPSSLTEDGDVLRTEASGACFVVSP